MSKRGEKVRASEGEVLEVLGVQVRFLCSAEETAGAWSLMENVVPKDCGPPAHHHPWDEAYYVVEGEIEFTVAGASQTVAAGEFLYAPGGTVHGFRGASELPARMLIFDAPAHAEAFFRQISTEVRAIPQDLAKMPAIGERHDVNFVHAA
jgi:quercetin dioxygenase-like cupin family protein